MADTMTQAPNRGLFKVRFSPAMLLLPASYLCAQAAYKDTLVNAIVENFTIAVWMFFLLSWALPLIALVISVWQLIRNRSLQHLIEIVVAAWLLIAALDQIVKATG
jgi:hypothetical protein